MFVFNNKPKGLDTLPITFNIGPYKYPNIIAWYNHSTGLITHQIFLVDLDGVLLIYPCNSDVDSTSKRYGIERAMSTKNGNTTFIVGFSLLSWFQQYFYLFVYVCSLCGISSLLPHKSCEIVSRGNTDGGRSMRGRDCTTLDIFRIFVTSTGE